MSDNIHLLAGAYALNALPLEERAFFERHLGTCTPCGHDVAGYLETATAMGMAVAQAPPSSLRARVLAEVAATRQPSPLPAGGQRLWARLQSNLAAVAVVVAAALVSLTGASVYLAETRDDTASTVVDAEFVATAETVRLDAPEGVDARFLYSSERDEGYLVVTGLDALEARRDYQLWLFHDGVPVPAGVFDVEDGRAAVQVQAPVRNAELVAVTVEPAGGLPEPSGSVLLSAQL